MLTEIEVEPGALVLRSPALAALGVQHAFTTRYGLGQRELDVGELTPELASELARLCGRSEALPRELKQVHGAQVHDARGDSPPSPPVADAQLGSDPDQVLLVRSADCVPILLASADGALVAAVHAGWRGQVAGVIGASLAAMQASGAPARVAAVGPCLSLARFEVGEEVALEFERAGLGECVARDLGPRPHVDLRAATRRQLEQGGVETIELSERCTWDDPRLWSHRRDVTHGGRARSGRLGALVTPARA